MGHINSVMVETQDYIRLTGVSSTSTGTVRLRGRILNEMGYMQDFDTAIPLVGGGTEVNSVTLLVAGRIVGISVYGESGTVDQSDVVVAVEVGRMVGGTFFPQMTLCSGPVSLTRSLGLGGFGWLSDSGSGSAGPAFPLLAFTAPVSGDFAWINQGGASIDTTTVPTAIYLAAPAGAGVNQRIRKKAQPAPPYTITAYLIPHLQNINYNLAGICWRASGAGSLRGIEVYNDSAVSTHTAVIRDVSYTSPTVFSVTNAVAGLGVYGCNGGGFYMRLQHTGANIISSISNDGVNFTNLFTQAVGAFLTPDEVGFWAASTNATLDGGMWLLSWKQA
jgi:hypothetical protein